MKYNNGKYFIDLIDGDINETVASVSFVKKFAKRQEFMDLIMKRVRQQFMPIVNQYDVDQKN